MSGDEATEDERGDGGELDQNVDRGAGRVLEGVTDGVSNHSGLVLLRRVTIFVLLLKYKWLG